MSSQHGIWGFWCFITHITHITHIFWRYKYSSMSQSQWRLSWLLWSYGMDLLRDMQNCGLRMRRECRERFPRHRLQMKPLVSDPGMHHGTCVTHVPWCMLGSLTHGGGENVPGIPGACASRNFAYLVRGPWVGYYIPYKAMGWIIYPLASYQICQIAGRACAGNAGNVFLPPPTSKELST